ncbi:hypothetical protein BDY21DRAFT_284690 [Lineolata rhizophorae]|uniref:Cyclin-domain-containing protein n=1 Tax=Lineolata rhizophorae TaxID=578093 RepID=A0A6A6P307_9PEZI|nr:hypothetical protein BDY21DRAFT_284690 [Lineolata rhizophorae]
MNFDFPQQQTWGATSSRSHPYEPSLSSSASSSSSSVFSVEASSQSSNSSTSTSNSLHIWDDDSWNSLRPAQAAAQQERSGASHVPNHDFTMEQPADTQSLRALQCGRRMFLAALILASKYLQDRNYSARAWSKISGLKVCEINMNEMAFLEAVNWKLHIPDPLFERWQDVVLAYTPSSHPPPSPGTGCSVVNKWKEVMCLLTPELDKVSIRPRTPARSRRPDVFGIRSPPPTIPEVPSEESTPVPMVRLPQYLEPKPDMLPPTPSLIRMGPLPTPQMTPQSTASSTPGYGQCTLPGLRPAMCSAMAQAQSACMSRTILDTWNPAAVLRSNGFDGYQFSGRRPSLAASTVSSASSPESMVSDNSSRSSRSSSICSVSSSAAWAPSSQANLARMATCRNARLPYPMPTQKESTCEYIASEPVSSPDFENFNISDPNAVSMSGADESAKSRKRGRASADLSLQQNVRAMLSASSSTTSSTTSSTVTPSSFSSPTPDAVLQDCSVASSFLLQSPSCVTPSAREPQSPCSGLERRRPVPKDLGRKRACCANEANLGVPREGPGMWRDVL